MKTIASRYFLIGLATLILGLAFYLFVRGNNVLGIFYDGPLYYLNLSLPLLYSLPSLFHTMGFILLTYSLRSNLLCKAIDITIFWITINLGFEFCQKGTKINSLLHGIELSEGSVINNYLNFGYFDWYDILFLVLGGLTAYLIISFKGSK